MEIMLFPFLFPQGNGTYDGKISIYKYFKYQKQCFFIAFTLFKSYLLIMYDVCQTIQLINIPHKHVLEKDINLLKQKN
jgi:hypothetical protein